ncbi:MAG: hypothetical protein MJE68_08610, partial [Proteobacteria bacterium]|nr:hypothetical protein [Pseudomonadota bacterium]
YGFYHISVQEFLAAVHLAVMEGSEQVSAVEKFLGNDLARTLVVPFYAGLTRLSSPTALKVISESLSKAGETEYNLAMLTLLLPFCKGQTSQSCLAAFKSTCESQHDNAVLTKLFQSYINTMQRAVAFTKCLYESQNESLMQSPQTDLPSDEISKQAAIQHLWNARAGNAAIVTEFRQAMEGIMDTKALMLTGIVLTPLDCLSLGYYIRAKHFKEFSRDESSFHTLNLYFLNCSIKDIGMRLLFTEMAKDVSKCVQAIVCLNLQGNQFDSESLLSLKELLQGPINIASLCLRNCLDPTKVDLGYALKCVIEGLVVNMLCNDLNLSLNPFNTSHVHHIILMLLTCPALQTLKLTLNGFGRETLSLFCHALALSSVNNLRFFTCNISDSELDVLGENLKANPRLQALQLAACKFSPVGFCKFLRHFKTSTCSRLCVLTVGSDIEDNPDMQRIVREINDFRSTLRFPRPKLTIYEKTYKDIVYKDPV